MKQILLPLIFVTLSFFCNAQTNNKITIGLKENINSKILNEKREFWVYVPNNDQNGKPSKQRYPVVYLLDGHAHFYSVVGLTHYLSINDICPEMIIVGILNTDRNRDLTPTNVDTVSRSKDGSLLQGSGEGDKFMAFIENELMPHIDSIYPTESYKMLIGHSLGGLTVMNTLIRHPGLYNAYVAIDPAMLDDNKRLLKASKSIIATKDFSGSSLFMGIANTMEEGMDTAKVRTDTNESSEHIRAVLTLNETLLNNSQNHLNYNHKYYPQENHGSVPLITEYDAFHAIFDFYELKIPLSELRDVNMETIAKINKHYQIVSKQLGYEVKIPEPMANNLGYLSLRIKHYDEAEYLFKLNTTNFPENGNVYDSLGDLYMAKGDKINAANNYRKALSIFEVPETRQKLESIQ